MYDDIAEFKRFYQTRLGQNVADLMRRQLDLFWHAGSPLSSAFLGYAQPFLDSNQPIPLGLMPARRGAASWPQSSSVRNSLVDPLTLPLPDVHLDRLLLVHALEFEHDPGQCLDECWRVLDGAGRLLVVVPNRSGLWAKAERTPFGHGRPYSGRQLRRLLQRHDLSRTKPTELHLCRLWRARFFSVLPQRLNESAAAGGQRWAVFFLSRLIKCSMHLRERQVDFNAVKRRLRRSWWGSLVGRCRQKFESRPRPYLAENRIAWP